jgi:two-component system, NarL family, sensor histidine kinase NreB
MAKRPSSDSNLLRRMTAMQDRLTEAEDTLNAIRTGAVDALVVHTSQGEQLFTLKGADQTYRALVEAMNEGAVTLRHGIISYCNKHFAEMVRRPMEKVFGASLNDLVYSDEIPRLVRRVQKGPQTQGTIEAVLRAADGIRVPVLLSVARFYSEGQSAVGLVVTDITDRKAAERARQELSRHIINAQEKERQRLSRELHDSVNQILSSAKYRLNSLAGRGRNGSRDSEVGQVRELIEKAIAEVRLISKNLRPSELDDLGLVPALQSLTHDFSQRSGIAVRFKSRIKSCPSSLQGEMDMTLYRIAQEALNNVEKHSGADRVELLLNCTRFHAQLTIHDNGKGFHSPVASGKKPGWGLQNMKERARLLGGTVEIESLVKKGTTIFARIPFENRGNHPNAKA